MLANIPYMEHMAYTLFAFNTRYSVHMVAWCQKPSKPLQKKDVFLHNFYTLNQSNTYAHVSSVFVDVDTLSG